MGAPRSSDVKDPGRAACRGGGSGRGALPRALPASSLGAEAGLPGSPRTRLPASCTPSVSRRLPPGGTHALGWVKEDTAATGRGGDGAISVAPAATPVAVSSACSHTRFSARRAGQATATTPASQQSLAAPSVAREGEPSSGSWAVPLPRHRSAALLGQISSCCCS